MGFHNLNMANDTQYIDSFKSMMKNENVKNALISGAVSGAVGGLIAGIIIGIFLTCCLKNSIAKVEPVYTYR